jgi:hypothetical protein
VASLGLIKLPNVSFNAQKIHSHIDTKNRHDGIIHRPLATNRKGLGRRPIHRGIFYILGFSDFAMIVLVL